MTSNINVKLAPKFKTTIKNGLPPQFLAADQPWHRVSSHQQKPSQIFQNIPTNFNTPKPSPQGFSFHHDDHPGPSKLIPTTTAAHTGLSTTPLHSPAMAPRAMPSHKTPQNSPKPPPNAPKLRQTEPPGLLSWNNHKPNQISDSKTHNLTKHGLTGNALH